MGLKLPRRLPTSWSILLINEFLLFKYSERISLRVIDMPPQVSYTTHQSMPFVTRTVLGNLPFHGDI